MKIFMQLFVALMIVAGCILSAQTITPEIVAGGFQFVERIL